MIATLWKCPSCNYVYIPDDVYTDFKCLSCNNPCTKTHEEDDPEDQYDVE